MVWPLELLWAIIKFLLHRLLGIVVPIPVRVMHRLRWNTTLPIRPSALLRQPQSRLYLQHGVAGKEARCPSKQGEVSYSISYILNEEWIYVMHSIVDVAVHQFPNTHVAVDWKWDANARGRNFISGLANISMLTCTALQLADVSKETD